jgi:eukaryotic-like serine/threonine-protein kinase
MGAPRERWPEIERLLDEALALPAAERPAYLDRACAGDPALRAEVERLLDAAAGAGDFLAQPAPVHLASLVSQMPGMESVEPGARLGGYEIVRPLGRGGMATVYLARDTKHEREVALKVLRPELAAALGTERFLQEIRITASLDHPHILTLIDSGSEGGFLWYVMPLVRGESLRQKIERERQLDLTETLAITRQVASALDYAHRQGVIHRDIKPENILLHEGEAMLADFGIARAVQQAGGPRLTATGVSIGTPQYMSPEQTTGERDIGARSDVYSLAAVLYEMLTGEAPHTGATAQAVIAKVLTERPTPIRTLRHSVPEHIEDAVAHALAKAPADRFASADELVRALEAVSAAPPARRRGLRWLWAAAALVVVLAGAYVVWPKRPDTPVNPNVVAVVPFRVAGADPSLHYLREGMIDLLAAKLTGEGGGLRAADPRTVTNAWRHATTSTEQDLTQDDAIRLARGLGAGRLLLGSIVGGPPHIELSATLLAVPTGRSEAHGEVAGPADSLPMLLDRLASQLVVQGARLDAPRAASLTTTSLPALQAYLAGQAAYRRGAYNEAVDAFGRALQLDSGFALAAFAFVVTSGWLPAVSPAYPQARQRAWNDRSRLSTRDRALLEAYIGPQFPSPSYLTEILDARERAVALAPDQIDAWYFLGDLYFHNGRYLGVADWLDRANRAFLRAIALDSTFAGPLSHLIAIAAITGDTTAARRFARLYRSDSVTRGEGFDAVVRWDLARTLDDASLWRDFWGIYDSSAAQLPGLAIFALSDGAGQPTVDSLLATATRQATTSAERLQASFVRHATAMLRGRPREARLLLDTIQHRMPPDLFPWDIPLLEAIHFSGDTTETAEAVRQLLASVDRPPGHDPATRERQDFDVCVLGQWWVAHGQQAAARGAIARLRAIAASRDSPSLVRSATICAMLLEAMQATATHQPDARSSVERLDSLMRLGPAPWEGIPGGPTTLENLALGRLFATLGDPARGLAAIRRGGYFGVDAMPSEYRKEECHLAAVTGDRAGAIRACQLFLAMRPNPEAALQPDVDAVRAELARLLAER